MFSVTNTVSLSLSAMLLFGGLAHSQEHKQYLAFPVKTDLQHNELLSSQHAFFVLLHGDAIVLEDGAINPAGIKIRDLKADMGGPNATKQASKMKIVEFEVFHTRKVPDESSLFLDATMQGVGKQLQIDNTYFTTRRSGDDKWARAIELTNGSRGYVKEEGKEDGIGNDLVKAYLVKTALSRLIVRADVYVSIKTPFDNNSN